MQSLHIRIKILIIAVMLLVYSCVTPASVYAIDKDPNHITRLTYNMKVRITSITIGPNITSIETGSFNNLHELSSLTVDEGNKYYSSYDNCLYDKNKTKLICFPQGVSAANIPNTVVEILPGALVGKSRTLKRAVKAAVTANIERLGLDTKKSSGSSSSSSSSSSSKK